MKWRCDLSQGGTAEEIRLKFQLGLQVLLLRALKLCIFLIVVDSRDLKCFV